MALMLHRELQLVNNFEMYRKLVADLKIRVD